MSFFMSESLKSKIDEETFKNQSAVNDNITVDFPIYICVDKIYYEVINLNCKDDEIYADLILSEEIYENINKVKKNSIATLSIFGKKYLSFDFDDIRFLNFSSIDKYLVKVRILINKTGDQYDKG